MDRLRHRLQTRQATTKKTKKCSRTIRNNSKKEEEVLQEELQGVALITISIKGGLLLSVETPTCSTNSENYRFSKPPSTKTV